MATTCFCGDLDVSVAQVWFGLFVLYGFMVFGVKVFF